MVMCPADHEDHRFPLPCVGLIVEMLSWKGLRWRPDGLASFFFLPLHPTCTADEVLTGRLDS